jgi:hypothetical protein
MVLPAGLNFNSRLASIFFNKGIKVMISRVISKEARRILYILNSLLIKYL